MPDDVSSDPTVALSRAVAAAVVRGAEDRPALFEAANAISHCNERVASRFGYCMAAAIIDELHNA